MKKQNTDKLYKHKFTEDKYNQKDRWSLNTWEAGGGGTVGRNGRVDTSEMWSGWVMNHDDMLCKLTVLTVCEEGQQAFVTGC